MGPEVLYHFHQSNQGDGIAFLFFPQHQNRDFGRNADSDAGPDTADAGVDVEVLGIAFLIFGIGESRGIRAMAGIVKAHPFVVFPFGWTPRTNPKLSSMGVTGQREVDVGAWKHFLAPMCGIMGKEYGEERVGSMNAAHGSHRTVEVSVGAEGWFSDILDANQRDILRYRIVERTGQRHTTVLEHVPSSFFLNQDEAVDVGIASLLVETTHIVGIVVIAQNAIYGDKSFAIASLDACNFSEGMPERYGFGRTQCDEVACEYDYVWTGGRKAISKFF